MINSTFTNYCLSEIKSALKKFGAYQYNDKGPGEVMLIDDVVNELKKVNLSDVIESLLALSEINNIDVNPKSLVSEVLHYLDGDSEYEFLFDNEQLMDMY